MATLVELQARTRSLHSAPTISPAGNQLPFSPFDAARADEMRRLFGVVQGLAASAAEELEGLDRALAALEAAAGVYGHDLVRQALLLFVTHDPRGRKLPLPTYFERHPHLMHRFSGVVGASSDGVEALLDDWREDPFFNEHHEHWHVVYGGGQKDRQGELFFYMHQQMLARYETERACRGAPALAPLVDYVSPMPESFTPDNIDPNNASFEPRPANHAWVGHPQVGLPDDLARGKAAFDDAVDKMELTSATTGASVDLSASSYDEYIARFNVLGGTIEPNAHGVSGAPGRGLHGQGHMVISTSPLGWSANGRPILGVMSNPVTSAMDPIFWRWHKMIDNVGFTYQEKLSLLDLDALPASLSVHDVIVCNAAQVGDGYDDPARQDEVRAWAETTFGGAHWDEDFSAGAHSTDTLKTYKSTAKFELSDLAAPGVDVTYLDHEDFGYVIRIQNTQAEDRTVTVRVWLCAEDAAENRRRWIEMDTFEASLAASSKSVVYRSARQSSVVKKTHGAAAVPPILQTPAGVGDPNPDSSADYCDCGWPYSMLLPRGNGAGMKFRLAVILSEGDIDMQGAAHECGSVSMCGTRANSYPDKKPMGWPYCFAWPAAGIVPTLDALDQATSRVVTIKFG